MTVVECTVNRFWKTARQCALLALQTQSGNYMLLGCFRDVEKQQTYSTVIGKASYIFFVRARF